MSIVHDATCGTYGGFCLVYGNGPPYMCPVCREIEKYQPYLRLLEQQFGLNWPDKIPRKQSSDSGDKP